MPRSVEDAPAHRKLALIICNDHYSEPNNTLRHSLANGRKLRDELTTIGFIVTLHENIENDMMPEIKTFADNAMKNDLVLFYYSGLSCQIENKNYLINVQENELEMNTVKNYSADVERILERLVERNEDDTSPLYVTLFILDCWRPYWVKNDSTSTSLVEVKGLIEMDASDEVLIQFACDANRTARNNLFTEHLLANITKDNVGISEVFERVRDNVYQESNQRQNPLTINGLHQHQQVYLNKVIFSTLVVPEKAAWKRAARTITGDRDYGRGPGSTSDKLHCPRGLSITPNHALLIADSSNHRIMKYNQGATFGEKIAGKNISGYGTDMLYGPTNVIFHKQSKSFIICDYHNRRLMRLTRRRGAHLETLIDNIECFGIAVDNEGSIYVSDTENHSVRRYRAGRKRETVVAGGHGDGSRLHQLNHPTYVFVGLDKSVYVSDSWNDRVMKWERGATVGVIVAGGKGIGKNLTQLDCPAGVLVDHLGRIYVADHWNNRVMRWDRGKSEGVMVAGSQYLPGDSAKQLNGPEGLAMDRDGNLYVADSYNHRVQRFSIQTN